MSRKLPTANDPNNLAEWSVKWLRLNLYCASLQGLAEQAAIFTDAWFRNLAGHRHLILTGETGCGKTHTAESVFKWVRAARFDSWYFGYRSAPPRVEWVEFAQLASLDSREFKIWLDDQGSIRHQRGTDLLFVEDLGAEIDQFKSGEGAERLRELMNEFKNRWLFITTNVPKELWGTTWDKRVEDRLHRSSVIVDLSAVKAYSLRP